ncbi:MAG: flagellar hook-length control protein FliK [Gammaproteobacteria bacterium]|nr:flagellar hook-length control protein FliK [Gammaproteobacteria bacterium]
MLAKNMLLPEVNVKPEIAKEPSVKPRESSNQQSSFDQQRDDFNQVMQRTREEQHRQAQQERRSELQAQEKRAQQEASEAKANQSRSQETNSRAENNARTKDRETDVSKTSESRTDNQNDAELEQTTATDKKQSEHSASSVDEVENKAVDKAQADVEQSSLDKPEADIEKQFTIDNQKQAEKQPDEIDTTWLDTVLNIVNSQAKDDEQSQTDIDAQQQQAISLEALMYAKDEQQSQKSLEQLLAELQNKSDNLKAKLGSESNESEEVKALQQLNKLSELNELALSVVEKKLSEQKSLQQTQAEGEQAQLDLAELKNLLKDKLQSESSEVTQELGQKLDAEEKAESSEDKPKPTLAQLIYAQEQARLSAKANSEANVVASQQTAETSSKQIDASVLEKSTLIEFELNQRRQVLRQAMMAQENQLTENKTKVIDLGAAPVVNLTANGTSEEAKNSAKSVMNAFVSELQQQQTNAEVPTENKTQTNPEQKLMDSLSASVLESLAPKNNAQDIKPEKVDVAGVMVDKTLQAPKLENIANVKNEVMIRENILFNKQELANHMQQQIGLMLSRNMKSVDIRMDPPELGAMQVRLAVTNDQATVSFVVSNQQTKDALEASLPKLREMLEQQGVELADSNVQQDNSQQQKDMSEEGSDSSNGQALGQANDETEEESLTQKRASINSPWNVSYYA